jgi:hypothetical protein
VHALHRRLGEGVESLEARGSSNAVSAVELMALVEMLNSWNVLNALSIVTARLRRRWVGVLLLGTNPCVPRSLEQITLPCGENGRLPDFHRQVTSGFFSAERWDSGAPLPDWNPIQEPNPAWKAYRDAIATFADLDAVAMANVILGAARTPGPWRRA